MTNAPEQSASGEHRRVVSSVRLKTLLLLFISVLVVGLVGLTYFLVASIADELIPTIARDLSWKAQRGAQELAKSADFGILVRDPKILAQAFAPYNKSNDVIAIVATDDAGAVLAAQGTLPLSTEELFRGKSNVLQQTQEYVWAWAQAVIEGKPVGKVGLVLSSASLRRGEQLRLRMLEVAGGGCLVALFLSIFFVNFYLGPLIKLTERTLNDLQHLNATLEHRVHDRTADLKASNDELQKTLDRLNATQRQLLDLSRRTGMAEVATAVLHNVGNVLNSVNVSVGLLRDKLRALSIADLGRLSEMIKAHESDIGTFISQDPKGKLIPRYIGLLADTIGKEQTAVLTEIATLTKCVDHIKVIVSMQQREAKMTRGVLEQLDVSELLEDALKVNAASDAKRDIAVVTEFARLPSIIIDRHKLFQVVMNLLSNARHAVLSNEGVKRITVRTEKLDGERFSVEVTDNGCGIAPDNLLKIFNQGFTTKRDGHGFGLHSSSLAAKELGGELTVRSDGPGKGASFRIELPVAFRSSVTLSDGPAAVEPEESIASA